MKGKKVKTSAVKRTKFADEKYLGTEPEITEDSTQSELARAYNWFNYFYTSDDAKSFTISYLKSIKYDKQVLAKLSHVKAIDLHNIGWNCRLLSTGSTLPAGTWDTIESKIKTLTQNIVEEAEVTEDQPQTKVVSIQDRISNKASDLIGDLEEQLDVFYSEGVLQFDIKKWSLEKGIKPQIAKRIAEHFRPQYEEITEAQAGKDPDLVEEYKKWRKPVLKLLGLFIKKIIDHMIEVESAGNAVRKPRAKKVKPAHILVSKMNYCASHEDYLYVKSVDPKTIIGANQLWVFNVKTRNLSVYTAVGHSGLSVRGSTITGYDDATAITKKLRKPEGVIKPLLEGGKIYLRKVMENIKCKEQKATGRINMDTLLLRVIR